MPEIDDKERNIKDLERGEGPLSVTKKMVENVEPQPLNEILENLRPSNEFVAQNREERLSKMLLTEISENEYKWSQYEDEKAEVMMELSDLVFEELIEEIVHGLNRVQEK